MALAVGRELAEDAASCQWANDAATVLVQPPLTIVKTTAINDPSVMRQRSIISGTDCSQRAQMVVGDHDDGGEGPNRLDMLAFPYQSSHGF